MPTCSRCGAPIQWLLTKNGKPAPFDLEPRSHFATCKKRPKPTLNDAHQDALSVLTDKKGLNLKRSEVIELVKGSAAETMEAIVEEVLHARDHEGVAR